MQYRVVVGGGFLTREASTTWTAGHTCTAIGDRDRSPEGVGSGAVRSTPAKAV